MSLPSQHPIPDHLQHLCQLRGSSVLERHRLSLSELPSQLPLGSSQQLMSVLPSRIRLRHRHCCLSLRLRKLLRPHHPHLRQLRCSQHLGPHDQQLHLPNFYSLPKPNHRYLHCLPHQLAHLERSHLRSLPLILELRPSLHLLQDLSPWTHLQPHHLPLHPLKPMISIQQVLTLCYHQLTILYYHHYG